MKPTTLIDTLYRLSFHPKPISGWRSNAEMRHAIESARRFVIDDRMAAFMADLANESFIKPGVQGSPLAARIADGLRVSARLPHESIWIEYPLRPYQKRSHELRNEPPIDPSELPGREGWLIQQHPKIETAHIMHLFTQADELTVSGDGYDAWTFPFAYAWCADDSPLPWRTSIQVGENIHLSAWLAGLTGYNRDNVACVRSPLIEDPKQENDRQYRYLMQEWMGVIRRVWALLATIDRLPIVKGEVRQSKGFLARGRIRPYLSHHTITLNVPARKDTRVLARKMIAAAHRARHEVRKHWRNDWRHPPSSRCNPHIWEFVDNNNPNLIRCDICGGRQFLISKHMRGTGEIGLTTVDYRVTHETDNDRA